MATVENRFLKVTEVPRQVIDGDLSTKYTDVIEEDGCWDAPDYTPLRPTATLLETDMMVD